MRRMRMWVRVALAAVAGLAVYCALAVEPAAAGITGPCSATIAGRNVASLSTGARSGAVHVRKDSTVAVTMSAGRQMTHLKVRLHFAGFSWTVKDKPISSNSWAESVDVNSYATYGIGLYLVEGWGNGPGVSCSGDALVAVDGNPLTTVAGGAGLAAAILGALGVAAAAAGGLRRGGRRPRISLLGLLGGLIGGLGAGVLLQQYAVVYPTRIAAIIELALGLGIGLVVPLLTSLVGGPAAGAGAKPKAG